MFRLLLEFMNTRFLPSCVTGPVLAPPWNLQRPFPQLVPSFLQGAPERVLASHFISRQNSG